MAATGIEEGWSVANRTSRLADVVRTGDVAVTTQVVDGTKEPVLARVGVARVRHQGDLILRRFTGLYKNKVLLKIETVPCLVTVLYLVTDW